MEKMIKKALEKDVDLTREEYAEKQKKADKTTAAHGVEGKAPISERERERRMRMNYYGTVINIGMSILAALDDINNNIKTLNNNIVILSGGTNANESESDTGN